MKLFIDSGPFIARINKKDPNHEVIIQILDAIRTQKLEFTRLFTSNYIVDESVTHVLYDTGRHDLAVKLLELIQSSKVIEILWISPEIEHTAITLFKTYKEQYFSFTDCTSFALMQKFGISTSLTFDHHFKVMKFDVIP